MNTIIKTFLITVVFSCSSIFSIFPSEAEITPDNTLPNNTYIKIEERNRIIEGGTQAGNNLFHSFQDFSLPSENIAIFNNDLNIKNIISRVTGGLVSNIDGLITSNGTANLFLINPNGIIFGVNARLNIGGSFLATTANSIKFADGIEFSAKKPQYPSLLTLNVPVGLQFYGNPGAINVQGNGFPINNSSLRSPIDASIISTGLQVKPGNTLALIGGDILLDGGVISAKNGKIELGSIEQGEVNIKSENNSLFFNYENVLSFRDISFLKTALVYINSIEGQGNTINIQGSNVKVLNGSLIYSQNHGSKENGRISINSENLEVKDASEFGISGIYSSNFGNTPGEDIELNSNKINIRGAQIATTTFNNAPGGNIKINANDYLKITGSLPSDVNQFGLGAINTFSYVNYGNGGNITGVIKNLTLEDGGNITTASSSFGSAGNLNLMTENIRLEDGSSLGSTTFNNGKGGNVLINANNTIDIIGRSPIVGSSTINAATFGSGNAGSLEINTSKLLVRNGGGISTSTLSFGNAGNLTIKASDSIEISEIDSNSKLPSFINSSAEILDNSLRVRFNRVPATPTGDAGKININSRQLTIANNALVSVKNDGLGNAGTLEIKGKDLNITNNGGVTATTAVGEGGNIIFNVNNVLLRNGIISATAGQQGTKGNGGNITFNAETLALLEKSSITANAFEGRGGNITINTQGFFPTFDSKITASSDKGIDGIVQINTLELDFTRAAIVLPAINIPPVAQVCSTQSSQGSNEFVNRGSGGIPPSPRDPLNSNYGWRNEQQPIFAKQSQQLIQTQATQEYVEAQGWKDNGDGTVSFTTTPKDVVSYGSLSDPPCHTYQKF
ncbi:filamentous hemagglutinin N-terminal domain-containing protein [Nostoc sp. ChiQUE01b]|uniref:two-partner secretion domain-containing protein n=1 Tax=Nostoc sp. ChiQUE01b TaxID=3075376 RepID=UPI002AD2D481|nr:filamentous hemagglutinin N-terminal domain-containing protein [Nostoc sp. ChiQUE01b]MDZ8259044.1 filamentous hemagglutinin N-terminal domain-containing protein [Nostoc sp. ChiQUE01b]